MNTITRLIMHRLASGEITLTWEIVEALKEANVDRTTPQNREPTGSETADPAEEAESQACDSHNRLTFVNPLPGRWIRRAGCTLMSALLLTAGAFCATASPGNLETANNAFARGNYTEAAAGFESVIAQEGYSAPVLFNLANAQLQSGQLGPAILNYERAALLAPNDPDVIANLRHAQTRAGIEAKPGGRLQSLAGWRSLNAWAAVAAGAILLIAVVLPLKQWKPRARLGLNWVGGMAGVALMVAVSGIVIRWPDLPRAVVTAPEATGGIAPVNTAQPLFKLRAGEIVTLERRHGDFALIKNQAGHEGWVRAGHIERIIPTARPDKS